MPVRRAGKNQLLDGHVRHVRRVILGHLQTGKGLLPLALDFGGLESRVGNHVADQIEGQIGAVGQNAQAEVGAVPIDVVVHNSSDGIDGLGNLA